VKLMMNPAKKPAHAPADAAAKKRPNNNAPGDLEAPAKRKKGGNMAAKNTSPINEDWIREGESFNIFRAQMSSTPMFKGTTICVKYHVLGSCSFGDGCQRKQSHTNALDETAKAEFDSWVKMCRKAAAGK
jgi:hypothetical protein